ncbi:hypothetical protein [Streptomyces jumonjinensis]|uniref:Toxin-antitoxin system, toxin component n=1 Tax=Streptomyces jumonjinensis TaxID=1945 RepID=A0A646KHD8_STRJU|nr:hypothetical protein [Streptomyces jumonjinensis]MQT01481.1 hypothetical protein [Streptomyces jumonjinensis]
MRRLREELARALEEAGPAGPEDVFAALCAHLGERRGRPVVLHLVDFPPQTASGLYLDMADRDVICVQAGTHPLHQLIIFGHEVWHMMAGHGHAGSAAVARSAPKPPTHGPQRPGDAPDAHGVPPGRRAPDAHGAGLTAAVQSLAARTDFRQAQEAEAETFGLELGAQLRTWLERTPDPAPRSAVAQRIQDSLGHRQG